MARRFKGIGVDLVETVRFKKVKDKKEFLQQLFTDNEILAAKDKIKKDYHWATIFAIKEAILKALGIGLHYGSYWHNIEITKEFKVHLTGFIKRLVGKKGVSKIYLSHSCTGQHAISFVFIEE